MNIENSVSNEDRLEILIYLATRLYAKVDGESYPAFLARSYDCKGLSVYIGGFDGDFECLGCLKDNKKRLVIRR